MNERAIDLVPAQRRFLIEDVPPVIGHRGAALDAPENTLAGIAEARRQGARWVEVDVKISAEQTPYLLHDDSLNRTTNGSGAALGRPIDEIIRLDAGSWFDPRFSDEKPPLLRDLFDLLITENMAVNLEIKPNPGEAVTTTQAIIKEIDEFWPKDRPKPLFSSFNIEALATARDAAPLIPRGLLVEKADERTLPMLDELACASLHIDGDYCDLAWLEGVAGLGIPVMCYTVNDPKRALELLDAGAHSIITDRPQAIILAILESQ